MADKKNKEQRKFSVQALVIGLILIGVVLLINMIMYNIPVQADLTISKAYSLSNTTIDLMRKLDKSLQITVYISQGLPVRRQMQDLMDDLKTYSGGKFSYKFIEIGDGSTEEDKNNRQRALELGIQPSKSVKQGMTELSLKEIIVGLNITYGLFQESMNVNPDDPSKIEYELVKKIEKMSVRKPLDVLLKNIDSNVTITTYITEQYLTNPIKKELDTIIDKVKQYNPEKVIVQEKIVKPNSPEISEAQNKGIFFRQEIQFAGAGSLTIIPVGYGLSFSYNGQERSLANVIEEVKENNTNTLKLIANIDAKIEDKIVEILPRADKKKIGVIIKPYDITMIWRFANPIFQNLGQQLPEDQVKYVLDAVKKDIDRLENPSTQALTQLSRDFYDVEMVDLENIENIADKYNAIIVLSTNSQLTEWELFHIDRYIMLGKPVAFLVDSVALNNLNYFPMYLFGQQQPPFVETAKKTSHNFKDMLNTYGIKLNENLIYETQASVIGSGFKYQLWPSINYYDNTPITNRFGLTTTFGWISSVDVDKENIAKNGIEAVPFLKTSETAGLLAKEGEDYKVDIMKYIENKATPIVEKEGQYTFGYMLKGSFDSFFKGKKVPEKPKKEGTTETPEEAKPEETKKYNIIDKSNPDAKVVVIGDRDFIADWWISFWLDNFRDEKILNNVDLMLNTLDWMVGEDKFISIRGKSAKPIQLNQEIVNKSHDFIMWGTSLGLPILVIIVGIFLFINDQSRKRALLERFNKRSDKVTEKDVEIVKDNDKQEENK